MPKSPETTDESFEYISLPTASFDGLLFSLQIVKVPVHHKPLEANLDNPSVYSAMDDVYGGNNDDEHVL